jgi:hypothetical protein
MRLRIATAQALTRLAVAHPSIVFFMECVAVALAGVVIVGGAVAFVVAVASL